MNAHSEMLDSLRELFREYRLSPGATADATDLWHLMAAIAGGADRVIIPGRGLGGPLPLGDARTLVLDRLSRSLNYGQAVEAFSAWLVARGLRELEG